MKLWRMWQLTIEGKILLFKTLAISKVVHLALVKNVPYSTIAKLEKIQKQFIWKSRKPKFKHATLCNKYEQGGLENGYFLQKTSLQCSWVKRLMWPRESDTFISYQKSLRKIFSISF